MQDAQKIGLIDLTTGSVHEQEISDRARRLFLGGRGINMYLLYTRTSSHLDPLSPDNPLIIGAGLLAGTSAPTAARCSISGKSPETGLLGDSNIGGYFAAQLRRTGFDHLVISGQSPEPVYVVIEAGRIHLRDASHLWGKDTLEAMDLIRQTHGPLQSVPDHRPRRRKPGKICRGAPWFEEYRRPHGIGLPDGRQAAQGRGGQGQPTAVPASPGGDGRLYYRITASAQRDAHLGGAAPLRHPFSL